LVSRDMDLATLRRVLEAANKLFPGRKITVCPEGLGESLLHPQFCEALQTIKEHAAGCSVDLNVNGSVMSDEHRETLGELLGPHDRVYFSINAPDRQSHEAIKSREASSLTTWCRT